MSQVRKLQTGGTFTYAGDEFSREDFKNQVIKNKDAYLASTNMTPRERELFEQGYSKIMDELNSPDYSKLDNGGWWNSVGVSSTGIRDKNIFGRSKRTDNNAIGFATGLLDYTLKRMPKKQVPEKQDYKLDFLGDIRNRYFGGKDLDYNIWKKYDEINPETNVRNHSVRSTMIADLIRGKIDELNADDFDSKYNVGSAYKDKQDLISRLSLLESGLRSGEINDSIFTSAASVGFTELAKLLGLEGDEENTSVKAEVQEQPVASVPTQEELAQMEYQKKLDKALEHAQEVEDYITAIPDSSSNLIYDTIGEVHGDPNWVYDMDQVNQLDHLVLRRNIKTGEEMWVDLSEMGSDQPYINMQAAKNTQTKQEPEYKYKDPNSIGRKLEDGEGFNARDYARMAAIGLDLTSLISAYAPGYGTLISGISGLASTATGLAADLTDKNMSTTHALGVAGAGLAADLVGLVPGLGTTSKVAKVIKTLKPMYKPIVKGLRLVGSVAAAETLLRLQANNWDPKSLTIDDVRVLAAGISSLATRGKVNRKAAEADALHTTQQNARRVATADGKTIDIEGTDYNKATRRLTKSGQQDVLKDKDYGDVELQKRLTNIPGAITGQNAPRVDKIKVDEAVERYKQLAKGKKASSEKAIADYRTRLQAEADRVNKTGKKVHDANVQKKSSAPAPASTPAPTPTPKTTLTKEQKKAIIEKLKNRQILSIKEEQALKDNKTALTRWLGTSKIDPKIQARIRAIIAKKGGVLFAYGGAKNTRVNGFNRNNFLASDQVMNYLKSLNIGNYHSFNQYEDAYDKNINELYGDQGGVGNWSNIQTSDRLSKNDNVFARQGQFSAKGNGLNDLLVQGFTGFGNSGDNKQGNYQDGLLGNQDIQRTFGRGVSEEQAAQFNNVLKQNNLEYYFDPTTGGGRIRPLSQAATKVATGTQTEPAVTASQNKAIDPKGRSNNQVFLKPEDMIAMGRVAGSIMVNNKNTKGLLKKMKPTLLDTYENFVPQQENYAAKASANNQASAIESEGRRIAQETADASLGAASRLQAVSNARNIRMQGDLQSDQRVYETGNLARQEAFAAKARRTEVANENRSRMNQTALAKENLRASNRLNNWQNVVQPFLAQIEQEYKQNRAQQNQFNNQVANWTAKKQYDIDIENLGKEAALEKYQTSLLGNSKLYNTYNFLFGNQPRMAASGAKLTAQEKKELQREKDFNSSLRQSQKLFYKNLSENKKSTNDLIKHISSFTARLISKSMEV